MKCILLAGLATGAILTSARAQWSHRAGDPMPHPPGHLVQSFTPTEWDTSNFAPVASVDWFRAARFGMFIHFGLSTHDNAELSWGMCQTRKLPDAGNGPTPDDVWQAYPKDFKLEKFDAREWVAIAQAGGCRYIVVIAKHHDGFHLWDTAYSGFKVTRTPFGRDYLKEIADACHAAGMPFGIYYSQRDWYHPDYEPVDPASAMQAGGLAWKPRPGGSVTFGERHRKYIEYQFNVCRELCTRYGKVDIFWWDAAWWGGMFTPDMWDAERLTRMVRELQPGILQNNRCSVPGDFDTPEQRLGHFQDWRPWESCVVLTSTWSYSGAPPKPLSTLLRMIIRNACSDGNTLLSWGPEWNGEFNAAEKARFLEIGAWFRTRGEAIFETRGGPWKISSWGGSTRRGDKAWLHVTQWAGETIRLPAIAGRTVISARLLNGGAVSFQQIGNTLTVTVPQAQRDDIDTIIELTFDLPVDDILAVDMKEFSIFDDAATYGRIVSRYASVTASSRHSADPGNPQLLVADRPAPDFAFHTLAEAHPWVTIDLGRLFFVTGLRILNRSQAGQPGRDRAATLRVSISRDGTAWQEVWKADRGEPRWEIPVTDFVAGAQVPGRQARYLRLEIQPLKPEFFHLCHVEVWGKEQP